MPRDTLIEVMFTESGIFQRATKSLEDLTDLIQKGRITELKLCEREIEKLIEADKFSLATAITSKESKVKEVKAMSGDTLWTLSEENGYIFRPQKIASPNQSSVQSTKSSSPASSPNRAETAANSPSKTASPSNSPGSPIVNWFASKTAAAFSTVSKMF